jgi:hypothetical protein
MRHPAPKLHPTPDRHPDSRPSAAPVGPLGSLQDIRASLAGDVLAFLTATTPSPPLPSSDVFLEDQTDQRGSERQALLRAAITDLKVMDVRLYHDRH